jgi:UPF0755 protein
MQGVPGNFKRPLMPHQYGAPDRRRAFLAPILSLAPALVTVLVIGISIFSLPTILAADIKLADAAPAKAPFPVTVDPINETIIEDPSVEALLEPKTSNLSASVDLAHGIFSWLAKSIAKASVYQQLAGSDIAFVDIKPGYRKEEVAYAFGHELGWSASEQAAFLKQIQATDPKLLEGELVPGTYMVSAAASPSYVQELLGDRFEKDILARYSTSTAELVPVGDTLTIASMLERETRDPAEMRLISGIIWNRLWAGMNLQIDATLQYAKASKTKTGSWWPKVVPADKYIKSPYNTYKYEGLPPGPISSPSTAAVLAALNPKKTDCLFYFHDRKGQMHCTKTYKEHVALLKKYYGQGK